MPAKRELMEMPEDPATAPNSSELADQTPVSSENAQEPESNEESPVTATPSESSKPAGQKKIGKFISTIAKGSKRNENTS